MAALLAAGCISAAEAQQYDPSNDFGTLAADNAEPTGIWSDGITMWVVDYDDAEIYAYNLASKEHVSSFTLPAENAEPVDIWLGGTTMYVVDSEDEKIYAYKMSDKSPDPSNDFRTLAADNNNPAGIWSDGKTMWVTDYHAAKIFAYNLNTKAHVSTFALAAGNNNPTGIWSNGDTMWVVDNVKEKIYAYKMSDNSPDPSNDFDTLKGASNNYPYGIWSNEDTMWVVDENDLKIYAYRMPVATQPPDTEQPPAEQPPAEQPPAEQPPAEQPPTPPPSSTTTVPSFSAGLFLPRDTTPPTVVSVERAGNATTADHALTWNVTFSEPVVIRPDVHFNHTSAANATIPDLGVISDAMLVDVPGAVTGGSVSVDMHHYITSDLLIELVAPDCTRFLIHNQTTTFLYMLRQPLDLGDLAGVGAGGWWTLHVSDHEKFWNGTLNSWTLTLESDGAIEGGGAAYAITRHVAGPGNHTLYLDGYDIRDRAGNPLADADPGINEPYRVVGAAARTCQTD